MAKDKPRRGRAGAAKMLGVGVVNWPANGEPLERKSLESITDVSEEDSEKEKTLMSFAAKFANFLKGETDSLENKSAPVASETQAPAVADDASADNAASPDEDPAPDEKGLNVDEEAIKKLVDSATEELKSFVQSQSELIKTLKSAVDSLQNELKETQDAVMESGKLMKKGFDNVEKAYEQMKNYRAAGSDKRGNNGAQPPAPAGGASPKNNDALVFKGSAFDIAARRHFVNQ